MFSKDNFAHLKHLHTGNFGTQPQITLTPNSKTYLTFSLTDLHIIIRLHNYRLLTQGFSSVKQNPLGKNTLSRTIYQIRKFL